MLGLSAKDLAREDRVLADRWQMLGVFPDDFDRAAVAAVWDVEESAAGLQLSQLAARSMVIHDDGSHRWRLHDLMRDVAQVPLEGEDAAALEARRETARARHARHYCGVLAAADELYLRGSDSVLTGLALYDLEQRNITAGQAWAAGRIEQDKAAARLAADYANAGAYVLIIRLHLLERIDWLEAQRRACARLGDRQGESYALGNLGNAWLSLGEPRRAVECYEQALRFAREVGDRSCEGSSLGGLGIAWKDLGEPRRAIEFYEQRLQVAREIGDRRGEAGTLNNLGNVHAALGEPRRAIECYEQSLAIAREIGDSLGEGHALGSLGLAFGRLGEPRRALEFFQQALEIHRAIGDLSGEANDLYNSALQLDALGERAEAVRRAQDALAIFEAVGAVHHVQTVRAKLAEWGAADRRP